MTNRLQEARRALELDMMRKSLHETIEDWCWQWEAERKRKEGLAQTRLPRHVSLAWPGAIAAIVGSLALLALLHELGVL